MAADRSRARAAGRAPREPAQRAARRGAGRPGAAGGAAARSGAARLTRHEIDRQARNLALERRSRDALRLIDRYLSQVDPDDVDFLILKGNILDTLYRFEEALRLYRRVLRIDPENPLALVDLADSYACCAGRHRTALRYYDRALRALESGHVHSVGEDEYIAACVGKADTLIDMGRPLDAVRCVLAGLLRYPTDLLLGDALQQAQALHHALLRVRAERRRRRTGGRGGQAPARGRARRRLPARG